MIFGPPGVPVINIRLPVESSTSVGVIAEHPLAGSDRVGLALHQPYMFGLPGRWRSRPSRR
jgi:hypothetical protein